jgi:hypothetical protein
MHIFIKNNWPWLSLLGLALVVTMPAELPSSLKAAPAWGWAWLRGTLQVFVSFRTPPVPAAEKVKP